MRLLASRFVEKFFVELFDGGDFRGSDGVF